MKRSVILSCLGAECMRIDADQLATMLQGKVSSLPWKPDREGCNQADARSTLPYSI